MSIKLARLLSYEEYKLMQKEALAKGWYRNDRRMFTPGMAWYEPWYFDPTGLLEAQGKYVMYKLADRGKLGFLSSYYWRDWSHIRPPMCVVLPNGDTWEMDRKANNGEGWQISGQFPDLIANPSINAPDYHGWLGNGGAQPGWFTADVEGRGPMGLVRPYDER